MLRSFSKLLLAFCVVSIAGSSPLLAQPTPPKNGLAAAGLFRNDFAPSVFFDGKVIELTSPIELKKEQEAKAAAQASSAPVSSSSADQTSSAPAEQAAEEKSGPEWVSATPPKSIPSPDADPKVRINPEAPLPFIGMAVAFQDGDRQLASRYADQFVRYQINLMYQVRELSTLIGEALIRQNVIEEEDWVGVEQFLDRGFAAARADNGTPLRATHEEGLKRIKADSDHKAEIYVFLNLNSKWARQMAPDIERLWQIVQSEAGLRMGVFGLGPSPKSFVASYKDYTGLTGPVLDGTELAKVFRVAFVPAVVVVTPNNKNAYVKTGFQTFKELYEFVRTAQGLPTEITPAVQRLIDTPIGYVEHLKGGASPKVTAVDFREPAAPPPSKKITMERF